MSAMQCFSAFGTFHHKNVFYCSPQCAKLLFLDEKEVMQALKEYVNKTYNASITENQIEIDPKGNTGDGNHYGAIVVGIKRK
jgi:hypothetical protein